MLAQAFWNMMKSMTLFWHTHSHGLPWLIHNTHTHTHNNKQHTHEHRSNECFKESREQRKHLWEVGESILIGGSYWGKGREELFVWSAFIGQASGLIHHSLWTVPRTQWSKRPPAHSGSRAIIIYFWTSDWHMISYNFLGFQKPYQTSIHTVKGNGTSVSRNTCAQKFLNAINKSELCIRNTAPSPDSYSESVCQHFRPSLVGVRGDADKELLSCEEDVAALQCGPCRVAFLRTHLHHGQVELWHHPPHGLSLQRRGVGGKALLTIFRHSCKNTGGNYMQVRLSGWTLKFLCRTSSATAGFLGIFYVSKIKSVVHLTKQDERI